jgi:hypothetical protein
VAIPNHYIKRRDLLHSEKSSPATLSATAQDFLAAERYSEALDFFEKARDTEGIKKIKAFALQHGDTFLLARLERFDRTLVAREDWDTAAKAAEAGGRPSAAAFVLRRYPPVVTPEVVAKPGEAPVSEV